MVDVLLCPQGDSNPCLSLERAPSWAARRWGRLLVVETGEIVSRTLHSLTFQRSVRDCIIPLINRQQAALFFSPAFIVIRLPF